MPVNQKLLMFFFSFHSNLPGGSGDRKALTAPFILYT